jgi:hypothetical protein
MNEAEERIKKLEASVKRLSKRGARFKPPQGPEEVAMEAVTVLRGHLIDAERFFNYYEAVDWKRGSARISNWRALLRTWVPQDGEPTTKEPSTIEEYYGKEKE